MLKKLTVTCQYTPYQGYESDEDGRVDAKGRIKQRCKNIIRVPGVSLVSKVKVRDLPDDQFKVSCVYDCTNEHTVNALEEAIDRSFKFIQTASSIYQVTCLSTKLKTYTPK